MKFIKKRILKDSFLKGIALIVSGTAGAQIINVLASPIITRLYTPEEYGVFTIYIAILGMLVIISSLRYEWSIPIAPNKEKAIDNVILSLFILFIFVFLITLFLFFFPQNFLDFTTNRIINEYKFLIPLGVLFSGIYNIFVQWGLRMNDYKSISITKINQSFSQNFIKIFFGAMNLGHIGLILGHIAGQTTGSFRLSKPLLQENWSYIKRVTFINIKNSAIRYVKFPLYSAPGQFLNNAGLQLPVLFIASIYGTAVSGYYALAHSIVNLPMVLIGSAVADVFLSETAKLGKKNSAKIEELINNTLKKLLLLGIPPLILLAIWGPTLFSGVFGEKWYEAGVHASLLSILVYTRFIFTPFTRIFSVFEKQNVELLIDILRVIFVLSVFLSAKFFNLTIHTTIISYSLVMSVVYLITFIFVKKIVRAT